MRSVLGDLLPDTCNILTASFASDGGGGWTETWGTTSSGVACRLDMQGGREAVNADALVPFTRFVLTCASSESLSTTNRVEHGGYTYNVISINLGASWKLVTRAILERVL
jgi:hypothetical protein